MSSQPVQGPGAQPVDYPGKTLGIVGLVLAIIVPLAGLIVSIVARVQSRNAGFANGPAKAGIIVSIVLMVLGVLVSIVLSIVFATIGVHSTYYTP